MKRETHAASMRQCLLLRNSAHKPFSLLSASRTGMQYSFLCVLPAEDKPVQPYPRPVASTGVSSRNSSNVYASFFSMFPRVASSAVKVDTSCEAFGAAKPVVVAASALQSAARPNAAASPPQPSRPTKVIRCGPLASSWSAANTSLCSSKTNSFVSPTAAASPSAKAGYNRYLAELPGTEWRILRDISPVPLRMAATAAWTATVTTAAAVATPTRNASLRGYKAAALLLPPLLLSTCCRVAYAATAAAPPLVRRQSAFVPAITIAALSLTSSPPPSDLLKQSGSFAARVQLQCTGQRGRGSGDVCNKGSNGRNCRHEGLLHMLRRRSTYVFFPLDSVTPFSSWTAAVVGSGSVCTKRNEENADWSVTSCSGQNFSHGSSEACSTAGGLSGGTDCEGFLSPLSLKSDSFSGWRMSALHRAGCTAAAGYSTCCSVAKEPLLSRAAPPGHLFAHAFSTSQDRAEDALKRRVAVDVVATAAKDRFNAHLQQPKHPAFDLIWQEPVPEMQMHVAYYVHRRTGVRVMSIAAAPQEREKVFSISFRTPVSDSTGVPHILEHSVLSGSKRYPLKEPFAELLKGSLYSLLNAYTYSEHTTYPVASVNTKDFYNLASVYLDAVLQPRVAYDVDVFRQEGWRVEASLPEGDIGAAAPKQKDLLEAVNTGKEEDERGVDAVASSKTASGAAAGEAPAEDSAAQDELPLAKRVKLSYQGVVLNEMKGVYSQPRWLLFRVEMQTIFPDVSAYAQDSGGNPEVIPSLTYEHFKAFYKRFYSLSNARIFFWGSDDIFKRLEFVDKNISELEEIPPLDASADLTTKINAQPAFKEPVRVRQPYPATTAEMEDYVTVTWVLDPASRRGTEGEKAGATTPSQDSDDRNSSYQPRSATNSLAITVLDHLLMGTTAAPLYKALASSHLGKEVIGGGLSDHKHFVFSVGLKGVPQEQGQVSDAELGAAGVNYGVPVNQAAVDRIENIVLQTLERCYRDGFEPDAIEAAMNTIEFRLREFSTGNYPKGLAIILQIVSDWMVDRDPLVSVKFERPLQNLKKRVERGEPVFQQLIKRLFLDNPHRATVHLVADADLEKELQRKDDARIEKLRESLTDVKVKQLVADTQKLKAKQLAPDPPEALATIPTLELSDVEEEEEIPTEVYSLAEGAVQVLLHRLPTAGILYVDVLVPLHTLDLKELQLLSLFARMLTQAGTSQMNEVALANYIGMHTGGLNASVDIRTVAKTPLHVPDPFDSLGFLVLSGKALKSKIPELLNIMSLVLRDADFSNSSRAIEILKEIEASTADSFINSGTLAALRVGASLTAAGYVAEQRGGVPYAVFIRQQVEQAKQNWKSVQAKLEGIRDKLLRATMQHHAGDTPTERVMAFINLTGDTETLKDASSLDVTGGRKLRQLAKLLTGSLPDGVSSAAAPTDGRPRGQAEDMTHQVATKRNIDAEMFLQKESDAADLEPLKEVEHIQGGTRIVPACDWRSLVQEDAQRWVKRPAAAEGFVVPTQVNYVYLGGRMLSPGERYYGHLSVVAEALSNNYVWDQVRVVGGAYGGSFSVNGPGVYVFRSYRDPQLLDTLQRYRDAAAGLEEFTNSLTDRGLTRAIIAVLRGFNQPQSNDQKGYTGLWRHIAGETKDHRAQYRDEVVHTTRQHFRDFAARLQKLLQVPTSAAAHGASCKSDERSIVAVVGSHKAFEEAMSGATQLARGEDGRGTPFPRATCPLRFELLDVKKATATTETLGTKIAPKSQTQTTEALSASTHCENAGSTEDIRYLLFSAEEGSSKAHWWYGCLTLSFLLLGVLGGVRIFKKISISS